MKNFYKKPSEYSQIPNSFAQDNNLTIEARGLGLLIYSLPDNWEFRQVWFYSKAGPFKNRAKTVIPALNELKANGYLASIQVRAARGKFDDAKWMFDPSGNAYKCLVDILISEGYVMNSTENTYGIYRTENTSSVDATSVDATSSPIKEIETNEEIKKEISSSSLSPPLLEEDEKEMMDCEIVTTLDPYSDIPEHIEELPRQIVIDGINSIATERGGDFENYRDSLIREVLSGKGRTITNIRTRITRVNLSHEKPWIVANRLKREQGEKLSAALRESGHDNIFDYLEEMKH